MRRNSAEWGLAAWVLSSFAVAQPLPPSLQKCSEEQDASTRLACYDREIARLKAATAGASSPAAPAPSPEENFGVAGELLRKKQEREESSAPQLKRLDSTIVKVTARVRGEGVYQLENGQVWEQKEVSSSFVVRAGDRITIEPGSLGTYWLVNEEGRRTRVKRVR
jgi:hypothetical protein